MLSNLTSLWHILQAVRLSDTWQQLEHCDVLLVRGDGNCGFTYKGKAYAPLHDSIGDLFTMRGFTVRTVAQPYSKFIGNHSYSSALSYNRYAFVIGILKRFVRFVYGKVYSEEWANKRRTHFWCRILEKANPRCVIGRQPYAGLCRAGKMKAIPVYDLQHGVIADEHPWYGEKYRINSLSRDLPDGFLCWDVQTATVLKKWAPQKGIDVRVIGNPWFSRFLSANGNDHLVHEARNNTKIFSDKRPVILVSLGWGMNNIYKYSGFNGVMVDALEKTILETADSYNWILRLHPVQINGPEKKLVNNYLMRTFGHLASVEWRLCSALPLPLVLQQVDLHISDSSTVVVEAGWMGIHSALLNIHICPGGIYENYYRHERNLGIVSILKQDTNIIKQWIKDTLSKGRARSTLNETGNALDTFIEEISAIGTNHTH